MEDYIQQVLAFDVCRGAATRVEKMVSFYTSRDPAVSDTLVRAAASAARHDEFAASLRRHSTAWDELWRVCDVRVPGDDRVQVLLRLHIAHLLQVCSRHTADLDARLPARAPGRCTLAAVGYHTRRLIAKLEALGHQASLQPAARHPLQEPGSAHAPPGAAACPASLRPERRNVSKVPRGAHPLER